MYSSDPDEVELLVGPAGYFTMNPTKRTLFNMSSFPAVANSTAAGLCKVYDIFATNYSTAFSGLCQGSCRARLIPPVLSESWFSTICVC